MKRHVINLICLIIIVSVIFLGSQAYKDHPEPHTLIYSVTELQVHLSSLSQLYPNQLYVIQGTLGNEGTFVFDDISEIHLPESNWKIYLVTYTSKPTEIDKQMAPERIRFMYKYENSSNPDIQKQIDQANAQEATLYQPVPEVEINNSTCVAVGVEGSTAEVNCVLTPVP